MNRLLIVSALRAERIALAGAARDATVARCGMGPSRVDRWLPELSRCDADAIVVAGVAGAVDPALRPGDVVVASEVRDARGWSPVRAAGPLTAALRSAGFRVHHGPVISRDQPMRSARDRAQCAATGAIAADMESAAIVRAAGSTPVAVVRVIVDTDCHPLMNPATVGSGARALWRLRAMAPAFRAWADVVGPRTVLLAGPRSFCAGVERAIDIVESALQQYPRPVYVRRQIVHNTRVVADLQAMGAVFVDELDEVPDDATVVFSAHGVAPAVRRHAEQRGLRVIDATCPLVNKVHAEARRFLARGDTVVLIGHDGHDESEGTLGEDLERIKLVPDPAAAAQVDVPDAGKVAFVVQTTLAVDDVAETVAVLRGRFPAIASSPTDDICYATTNRQLAVRAIAAESDVVLVVQLVQLVQLAAPGGGRAPGGRRGLPDRRCDRRSAAMVDRYAHGGAHGRGVSPTASGRRGGGHAGRARTDRCAGAEDCRRAGAVRIAETGGEGRILNVGGLGGWTLV